MQDQLSPVWKEIQKYISAGLSLIPIRDKDEGEKKRKTPYGLWKNATITRYTEDELWHMMVEQYNTSAIGIVCGAVSGNLEAVDIDVKFYPGIDAILFAALRTLYPELWARLRIHKTPSGGYHLIYRIIGRKPDGNRKLAGRFATPEEVAADKIANPQKRRELKEVNFLETRGEAGFIAAPPSLEYAVYHDVPIPDITYEERCSIIELCISYNQIVKVEAAPRLSKPQDEYYDLNPFEDFNQRCDPTLLVEANDWKFSHENNHFIWYTRPGKNDGVSLSWNKTKLIFYSFSTSTELDAPRGYNASSFLSIYQFNGDGKATHAYLVQHGYGKVKPKIEAAIVKKAATNGTGIPANFTKEAKEALGQERAALKEAHPHGIFWETDEEGKVIISRERLYAVSEGLGFRLWQSSIVQIIDKFIHNRTDRQYFDSIKSYIKEEDGDLYEDICNSYESFIQKSGSFTVGRLLMLPENGYSKDTRQYCQKFFENGFLTITASGSEFQPYEAFDSLVFANRVRARPYINAAGGLYVEYLNCAIGISTYLKQVIGFLSHEYKDNSLGYIVILTEQAPDPKLGGGSGKNLFGHLLKGTTTVTGKAASQTKMDDKLFQIWAGEKIFTVNDLPKDFDLVAFKDISTDGFELKKLFKDVVIVNGADGFKLMLSTNFSYECSDGGLKRRVIPVEFTPFFTSQGGVKKHFGKLFPQDGVPDDWNEIDWAGYDNFIADAVIEWFKCGMELTPKSLSNSGWEKQFIQIYKQTAFDLISTYWDKWVFDGMVENKEWQEMIDKFYKDTETADKYRLSSQSLHKAVTAWAEKRGFSFDPKAQKNGAYGKINGKLFTELNPPPF